MTIASWIDHLHLETTGPSDGEPVLIVHGWGSSAALMHPFVKALEPAYRVYNIDLPGHGETPPPPAPWGIPEHAELIDALIKEKIGTPVHFIGHSNGGRLSLYMAGDPATAHHFRSLSLISPSGVKPLRSAKYYFRRGLATILKAPFNLMPDRLKAYGLDWLRHTLVWQLLGSSDYSALQGVMRETFVKTVNCYVEDRLANIKAPTLLMWGTKDEAISRHQMQVLNSNIADSALIELKGASHYGYLDQPNVVMPAISHFLSQIPAHPHTISS